MKCKNEGCRHKGELGAPYCRFHALVNYQDHAYAVRDRAIEAKAACIEEHAADDWRAEVYERLEGLGAVIGEPDRIVLRPSKPRRMPRPRAYVVPSRESLWPAEEHASAQMHARHLDD